MRFLWIFRKKRKWNDDVTVWSLHSLAIKLQKTLWPVFHHLSLNCSITRMFIKKLKIFKLKNEKKVEKYLNYKFFLDNNLNLQTIWRNKIKFDKKANWKSDKLCVENKQAMTESLSVLISSDKKKFAICWFSPSNKNICLFLMERTRLPFATHWIRGNCSFSGFFIFPRNHYCTLIK